MIWFTGCTHFGHARIIELANRPFKTVEEMDAALIENWNERVGKTDTVYHLGDFAWKNHRDYVSRLNGRINFIRGNHDKGMPWESHPYMEIKHDGRAIVLFHYPIEEWNGWYRGAIHAHCHTHQNRRTTGRRRVNVTVEAWGYEPIPVTDLILWAENSP